MPLILIQRCTSTLKCIDSPDIEWQRSAPPQAGMTDDTSNSNTNGYRIQHGLQLKNNELFEVQTEATQRQ